jgi:N-acetyl-gamma-glutamyl-phosphate reductase
VTAGVSVGVLGASGYAGAEVLRICAGHPGLEVAHAGGDKNAGAPVSALYPHLAQAYPDLVFEPEIPAGLDLVFLALPHGLSGQLIADLDAGVVIDLAADFRHDESFAYGLVELFRDEIAVATRVAVPGCYVTAAVLAMAPLLKEELAEPEGIVVDAYSGVTGAGSEPKAGTMFASVAESMTAYGLLDHRHTPEMESALTRHVGRPVELLFTPHLAPANRGILATCYLRPTGGESTEDLLGFMASHYKAEPFVEVSERIPVTKNTLGSNSVHLTVRRDPRTGWIIVISALDNLVKGAAGQAVQCANLVLGLEETTGLTTTGVYP